MDYRILWTWDSWLCDPFDGDSYIREYRALIDFMADSGYNGLIIWGFVDDCHGGVAAAQEVSAHALRQGVRVLPGVGAGGYGGFVTSPGHPFNLETFLHENPHLRAHIRANGQPSDHHLCLYQDQALDWLRAGAHWLADTFAIGGVNIETNEDSTIDICPLTEHATEREPNRLRYPASFTDLARAVPVIHSAIRERIPDAWTIYATYSPMWWDRQEDGSILQTIPAEAIAQWNCEMAAEANLPPPVPCNLSLVHSGGWSYHLAAFPPVNGFTQYRCFYPNLEQMRQFAFNQRAMGLPGFVLGNAGSAIMPDNEINYLACIAFARDPQLTIDVFAETVIARLYGAQAAEPVKRLFLEQTAIHEHVCEVWKTWTYLLLDHAPPGQPLPAATQADVAALHAQRERALGAFRLASPDGQQRLARIVAVLREYEILAQASRDPMLRRLAVEVADPHGPERHNRRAQLLQALVVAGLPPEAYRCKV